MNYPYSYSYLNGLGDYDGYSGDSLGGAFANIQPTGSSSSSGGFNWGGNITNWLQLAPNLISSIKGNSYGGSQYGQQGGGQYGQGGGLNISGGVPLLGGGSLGISSNMLLMLAVAAVAIFALKK